MHDLVGVVSLLERGQVGERLVPESPTSTPYVRLTESCNTAA